DGHRATCQTFDGDVMAAGEGGVFGGAVAVDELDVWQVLADLARVGDGEHIATGQQLSQGADDVDVFGHDQVEECCRQPNRRNPVGADEAANLFRRDAVCGP